MSDLGKHNLLIASVLATGVFALTSCSTDWFSFSDVDVIEEDCDDVYYKVTNQGNEPVLVPISQNEAYGAYEEKGAIPPHAPYGKGNGLTYDGYNAPDYAYNTPVGGGAWVERTPYNALPEQYGNASEDMSSTVPPDPDGVKYISMYGDDCEDTYATTGSRKVTPVPDIDDKDLANLEKIKDGEALTGATGNVDGDQPVLDWMAPEGSSLRSLLIDWSDKSDWKLVWKTDREYILEAGAMFRGRYEDVASAIIRTFARARPAPIATFYKGNKVLVITTLEDENAD